MAIALFPHLNQTQAKAMNSQLPVTNKSHFLVLVGVSQGVIDLVELFDDSNSAQATLDRVRHDYHPEADDLQVFSVLLTAPPATSQLKL